MSERSNREIEIPQDLKDELHYILENHFGLDSEKNTDLEPDHFMQVINGIVKKYFPDATIENIKFKRRFMSRFIFRNGNQNTFKIIAHGNTKLELIRNLLANLTNSDNFSDAYGMSLLDK